MNSLARLHALTLVMLLLAGCTLGQDYVRPEVESPAAWRVDYAAAAELFAQAAQSANADAELVRNAKRRLPGSVLAGRMTKMPTMPLAIGR